MTVESSASRSREARHQGALACRTILTALAPHEIEEVLCVVRGHFIGKVIEIDDTETRDRRGLLVSVIVAGADRALEAVAFPASESATP